jgi:hypothetical protein
MPTSSPLLFLFILAIPIACITWTITHEELTKEWRMFFHRKSIRGKNLFVRKFSYMLTCEFCFSHYVTIAFLFITRYKLLYDDWRGFMVSGFSLVWLANIYMSLYGIIRLGIKKENIELDEVQEEIKAKEKKARSEQKAS